MNYKYTKSVKDDVADIFIMGEIGSKIDGDMIASEINFLNSIGVTEIREHINSPGGNVFHGLSVVAANINSKAKIITINEGIAASIAAVILVSGDEVQVFDFSQTMIHEPSLGRETIDNTKDPKTKAALIAVRNSLRDIIVARSNKTSDEIEELLKNETWLNALQAKELGLVTKILTPLSKPKFKNNTPEEILSAIAANYNYKSKTETKMKVIASYLKLAEDAQSSAIIDVLKTRDHDLAEASSQVDKLTTEKETVANELTELKASSGKIINDLTKQVTDFIADKTASHEKLVKDLIAKHISEGKFTKEKEKEMHEIAISNFDVYNTMMNNMAVPHADMGNHIEGNTNVTAFENVKIEKGELRRLEKEDPKLIEKIMNENMKLYKDLYKAQYGTDY